MTLADLVLAAASEPHVRAPLACRRKVAREGILEPAPFTPPSPDRVRAITSPDEPSRIAAGRLRGELHNLLASTINDRATPAMLRPMLWEMGDATTPTHGARS